MSEISPTQTFLDESHELLDVMEDLLLNVESNADDPEAINTLFRAVHTIKGSSGVFGFDFVVEFTHGVETVMDQVRAGERALDADLASILLDCKDHISSLVDLAVNENASETTPELSERGTELLTALGANETSESEGSSGSVAAFDSQSRTTKSGGREIGGDHWHVSLRFHENAFRDGMDPLSFLRYLRTVGEVIDTITVTDRVRNETHFNAESCYLGFEISLQSDADKKTIENVFTFAEEDCDIVILPPQSQLEKYLALMDNLPDDQVMRLGEMLVSAGVVTQRELERALVTQQGVEQESEGTDKPSNYVGEILLKQGSVAKPVLDGALNKQSKVKEKVQRESKFIRVDAEKLGQLINLVGELVTASAGTELLARNEGGPMLQESIASMNKLVADIRDSALTLRMVQIGETFNRFRRIVRDLSRDMGKAITLNIEGGETELDKTVVESLSDPLMHLVRNAIDHGIESPEQRKASGKPGDGSITLSAYHDSGSIVICIEDDGVGLDVDKLRDKAIAKGVISADAQLNERDLLRLIFEPGLSTKDQATDVSGRGVGMDVVKRNIEAARGTVEVESTPGQGTTVLIRLPLTLAIIDGFLVGSGKEPFVIPLDNVVECVELQQADWEVKADRHFINLRGQVLPFVRIKELFGLEGAGEEHDLERENLVVVRHGKELAGLVVDSLEGELQTVIKPLGAVLAGLRVVSGATIMGNGQIAMILDIEELVRHASLGIKRAA